MDKKVAVILNRTADNTFNYTHKNVLYTETVVLEVTKEIRFKMSVLA